MNAVMKLARTITNNMVIESLKASGGRYIDDHNGGTSERTCNIVGRFMKHEVEHIVMLFEETAFCINPLYMDDVDNRVHLNNWSIGGVLNDRRIKVELEEAVAEYNMPENHLFHAGTITEIIRLN